MKKPILSTACILLLSMLIISCSKDDAPSFTEENFSEENFSEEFLSLTQFNEEVTNNVNASDFEFGLEFTPTAKGNITSITAQLPDANNDLRVTFWDTETKTVLRTENVNVEAADTNYTFAINSLELAKDKKYMITMNSDDWYRRSKTNNEAIIYPVTVGNININSYGYQQGSEQVYPTRFYENYYAGDLFFTFQRTE